MALPRGLSATLSNPIGIRLVLLGLVVMPTTVLVLPFDVDGHPITPHNSNPRPANAAALLKQEEAATSAAGALDADSNGSNATAE